MSMNLNDAERSALANARYFLRALYMFGIRPYMDFKTGIVGLKRRISWQSLREELYVEPEPGISCDETGLPSESKVRRAVDSLERLGLIRKETHGMKLIIHCILATQDKSIQNRAGIFPTPFFDTSKTAMQHGFTAINLTQTDTLKTAQGDTPPEFNITLEITDVISNDRSNRCEEFWKIYPRKVKKQETFKVWKSMKLDAKADEIIARVLEFKAKHRPWIDGYIPHPTTFLRGKRWEDEIEVEVKHAAHQHIHKQSATEKGLSLLRSAYRNSGSH